MVTIRSLLKLYLCAILASLSPAIASELHTHQVPVISYQEEIDLELFETSAQGTKSFFELIDRTHTTIGRQTLKTMLKSPLCQKEALEQRQSLIKALEDPQLASAIDAELTTFKQHEQALYSLWEPQDPVHQAALEEFYFSLNSLKKYNASPALLSALQVLNVGNMFAPLLEHMLLHFLISDKIKEDYHIGCNHDHHGHDHSASNGSVWAYNIYNAVHFSAHLVGLKGIYDHIAQKATVIKSMQARLISVSRCIQSMRNIYAISKENPLLRTSLTHYAQLSTLFEAPLNDPMSQDSSAQLIALLASATFQGEASTWSNIGNVLAAYHLMAHAHLLRHALDYVGDIDAHRSITKLYEQNRNDTHGYSYARYKQSTKPQISIAHVWNPNLTKQCTAHTLELGNAMPNNAIITGDNATGKSTLIKSVALAILLAQTFTIAPAQHLEFTPFAKITTSVKHSDNIQAGTSLFITESLKAQALIEALEKINPEAFTFAIFDELFKSTSAEKGQKTARELINQLSTFTNSMGLFATHYASLTTLEEEKPSGFKNYVSNARPQPDGTIIFDLTPGTHSI